MTFFGCFVGLDTYLDDSIMDLRFAKADASTFRRHIESTIDPQQCELRCLLDADASRAAILRTIGEDFARLCKPSDMVLLYFAGHGTPETTRSVDDTSRYLVCHDTEYESIFATAIDIERDLQRLFQRLQAEHVLLIIDACFSGRAGGRSFEGPNLTRLRSQYRSPLQLHQLELGRGRIMIAAADENEVASEEESLQHGVFTHYLLDTLTNSNEAESTIGIGSLYEEVSRAVHQHTSGRQNPVFHGRSQLARFPYLTRPA